MGIVAGTGTGIVLFLLIHIIKMFRMYLVLLEQKIDFKRFVFAYCRTTLLNLIIPFKLGELYRIVVYSRITKSAGIGIAGVIVDRFFDTLALVLILLPLHILFPSDVSAVSVFLAVFVVLIVFIYAMFPSAYGYLNRYIIMNRESARSMAVLKWLEVLDLGYIHVKKLVSGRYALITLMSFAAWVIEGCLLMLIARIRGFTFNASVFSEYITSILSTMHSELKVEYTFFCIVVMAVFTLISAAFYIASDGVRREKKK